MQIGPCHGSIKSPLQLPLPLELNRSFGSPQAHPTVSRPLPASLLCHMLTGLVLASGPLSLLLLLLGLLFSPLPS